MKFYYFYKITNLINQKFYFGVHSTSNLNDGYMGSGIALKKAYEKYGVFNFKKEILYFFDNQNEMYSFEELYINEQLVNNQMCYNLIVGGRNKKVLKQASDLAKQNRNEKVNQKIKSGIHKYWTTGDIQSKKKKQSQGNKKYWTTGDVQAKKKKHSQIQKASYINHPQRRQKIINKLNQRWNGENGELNRKNLSNSLKNSAKKKQADRKIKDSHKYVLYNNPDFQKRWKNIYEKDMILICELLKYSNLPDAFIIKNMFSKKVHVPRVINYYKHLKILPNQLAFDIKTRFLKFNSSNKQGHKDGGSKKSIFSQNIKYNFMFLHEDFFKQWKEIVNIMNNNKISDSMVINLQKYKSIIPNFHQVIEYFQKLGIINNIETILIRTDKKAGNKEFTVPAKKTKFEINYNNLKFYLVDKEFNTYGIDDNGDPFRKGKFELEIDGKKHPLRCL